MIGKKLENDIISIFARDITRAYSINQLAKLLNKKYPYIHKKVTEFIKEKILTKQVIGRSFLCSLNYKEPKAVFLVATTEAKKTAHFKQHLNIKDQYHLKALIILTKKYPIRLVFTAHNHFYAIVQHKETQQQLKKHLPTTFVTIYTKQEFQAQLLDKYFVTDHIILYGYEWYGECIAEIQEQLRVKWLFEEEQI